MPRENRGLPSDVAARYILPGESRQGGAVAAQAVGITVLRFPPTIYPIPEARGFTLYDAIDSAVANDVQTPAGLTLALTVGYTAVVRSVTIDMNDITVSSDVKYAIRVSGSFVPGYDNLRHFPRNAASVSRDFDSFIVVPDGQKLDVVITNIDGGSHKIGVSLVGWSWPTASGRKWMGE